MKIAMVFPGYGSQFVGMGKELYNDFRVVQEYFEEASSCANINFVKLCFASSDAELSKFHNAYGAIFLVSSALYALIKELGIHPTLVSGYNQGEYAALFAAGAFTFPDGLYILTKYSLLYQELLKNMDTIQLIKVQGLPATTIEEICLQARNQEQLPAIAIYYDTTTHYVVGDYNTLEAVRELAYQVEHRVTFDLIPNGYGFHTSLMNSIVEQLKMYLEKVDCKDLKIPCISGSDGTYIKTSAAVREHILDQINHPINLPLMADSLVTADIILEMGPGNGLSEFFKKRYPDKQCIALNKKADIEQLQNLVHR